MSAVPLQPTTPRSNVLQIKVDLWSVNVKIYFGKGGKYLLFRLLSTKLDFLKPFLKGKILRSSERGVNSILTTILRF